MATHGPPSNGSRYVGGSQQPQYQAPPPPPKRPAENPPEQRSEGNGGAAEEDDRGRKKRKSRWATEEQKAFLPGVATAIPLGIDGRAAELYAIHVRMEEIRIKLASGLVIPADRSPSPPPTYDQWGKRTNTADIRYKKRLEDERDRLIKQAMKLNPAWQPPAEYASKMNKKTQDKVYIPAKDYPGINFIGLLIGPRGKTLQKIESEHSVKISIRGKGSQKEGKQMDGPNLPPGMEEEMHCLISGVTEEGVKGAADAINKIIEIAASTPESQNDLKRQQLRDLAILNGTLRDDEGKMCQNCGAVGHKRYECPEKANVTASITCRICGGAGHMARDCAQRNDPKALEEARQRDQKLDAEYASLIAELDGPGQRGAAGGQGGGSAYGPPGSGGAGGGSAPWQGGRGAGAGRGSAPWQQSGAPEQDASAYQWGGYGYVPPPGAAPGADGKTDEAAAAAAAQAYYDYYGYYDYSGYYGYAAAAPPPPGDAPPPPGDDGAAPPPPPE
ncbi:hypothetical protein BJ742DRAFT_672249 [Cladochytrium replicatum]|nr:hypothetical protein BJ742DRAFT_672249 [Cladochytrium replicatum]